MAKQRWRFIGRRLMNGFDYYQWQHDHIEVRGGFYSMFADADVYMHPVETFWPSTTTTRH